MDNKIFLINVDSAIQNCNLKVDVKEVFVLAENEEKALEITKNYFLNKEQNGTYKAKTKIQITKEIIDNINLAIDVLGIEYVAYKLKVSAATVCRWRDNKNKIPAQYYINIMEMYKENIAEEIKNAG